MGLPANIREFLDRRTVAYQTLLHPRTATLTQAASACDIPVSQLVRAVILVDGQGLLMAVLPADHVLDFEALCALLHRNLELVPGSQQNCFSDRLFHDFMTVFMSCPDRFSQQGLTKTSGQAMLLNRDDRFSLGKQVENIPINRLGKTSINH